MAQKFFKILKYTTGIFLLFFVLYVFMALLLSYVPVNEKNEMGECRIFLHTNGVHLDIIIPVDAMDEALKKDLVLSATDKYVSFGWGDKDFYLNTPEWKDLKLKTAVNAMLFPSETLLHLSRYQYRQKNWVPVRLNRQQLARLNHLLNDTFAMDAHGNKQILPDVHYATYDNFYQARGSYSLFKTCNTWVNSLFKNSGLKSSLWTPFDFGLMHFYE